MTQPEQDWVLKYLLPRLSELWQWYQPRRECKNNSAVYKLDGRKKVLQGYRCAECGNVADKIQIDHRIPKGRAPRTLDEIPAYLERYFCPLHNLQSLCQPCHKVKTKLDMKLIRSIK